MAALKEEERALAAELPPSQWPCTSDSPFEAWYMDDSTEDQRLPHRLHPNQPCPPETLHALGVRVWALDVEACEKGEDAKLAAIRKARGYNYDDLVTITPHTLPDYENKLKSFYQEHLHTDEEIRFMVDGSGYFDVRDLDDRWVRMWLKPGALVVLPEGIYHRFTLDQGNYAKALRLFAGVPVWTPHNRPEADDMASRTKYMAAVSDSSNGVAVGAAA